MLRTPHAPTKPGPPLLHQNSPSQAQWNRHGRPRFHTRTQQPRHGWSRYHTHTPADTQTTPALPKLPISGAMEQAGATPVSRTHRWFSSPHAKPRPSGRNTTRPPDPIGVGRSVAVALGFEPRVAVTPHSISSAAPSAARTRYLTRLLYYRHPLRTQIGHARWEQSHIRAPLAATVTHPRSRPPATVGIPHVRRTQASPLTHPDSRSTQVDVARRRPADRASFTMASTAKIPHTDPTPRHGFSPDSSRHAGYGLPCQGTYSTQ